jgi:two-component system response regulator
MAECEILIVEDDRDELAVALWAFRRAGLDVDVSVAHDGQEALEILGLEDGADPSGLPKVMFLDLKMPRVDGWEVLRRVRQAPETASLPVVVISSSDREEDVRTCYALGANSFLVKRFDNRSPGAYLAEAAHYWIALNEPPPNGDG